MFFFLFSFTDDYASGLYLSVAVGIAGLIATSRLIAGNHSTFEVWAGLFVGMVAGLVGWYWPF